MKQTILAGALALSGLACQAADYYIVAPFHKPTASTTSPAPAIKVALNSYALPSGMVNVPYAGFNLNSLLTVTGDSTYGGSGATWRVASGALPAGISLSAGGLLSGTPTSAGTGSFTLEATYKTKTGTQAYQIVVAAMSVNLSAATLPAGIAGEVYSGYDFKPLVTANAPNFDAYNTTWSVSSGTLPAGVTLNPATGVLSGTPTASGSYSFTVRATYLGANGEQSYDISVSNLVVSLAAATLPYATPGTSFSYNFKPLLTVTGDPTYADTLPTWSVSGGALPGGLTLSGSQVSGTPALFPDEGQSFTLKAAYRSKSAQQSYTLYPVDPYWSNVSFATHADGADGSTTIPAAKGTVTSSGNLSLSSTNAISGSTSIKGTGGKLRVSPDASVSLGTSDFTIEFWAYPLSQTSSAPQLVTNYNASESWGANTWGILPTHPSWPNRWGLYVYNANTAAPFVLGGVGSLALNTWTHVAVTRQGSTFRLFVNGNLSSSGTFTGSMDGGQTRGMNFFNDGANANPFQGYLDEVRVTKGVARYTSNFTPTHISFPTR